MVYENRMHLVRSFMQVLCQLSLKFLLYKKHFCDSLFC